MLGHLSRIYVESYAKREMKQIYILDTIAGSQGRFNHKPAVMVHGAVSSSGLPGLPYLLRINLQSVNVLRHVLYT